MRQKVEREQTQSGEIWRAFLGMSDCGEANNHSSNSMSGSRFGAFDFTKWFRDIAVDVPLCDADARRVTMTHRSWRCIRSFDTRLRNDTPKRPRADSARCAESARNSLADQRAVDAIRMSAACQVDAIGS